MIQTLSLIFSFSLLTQTQAFTEVATETSRFASIQQWHESGEAITWPELKGAWTGRCFETWAPNLALNILATSFSVLTGSDAGPGFPDEEIPYMGLFVQQDRFARALPADFFDAASPSVIRHSRDSNYALSREGRLWPLWEDEESAGWEVDHQNDGRADLLFSARKHETYWVLRIGAGQPHQVVHSYALGQQRRAPRNEAYAYCYFFENFEAQPPAPDHSN